MSSDVNEDFLLQSDSEDELDWEEVEVPEVQQHLEITLDVGKSKTDAIKREKKGISHAERLVRIDCHKLHTVTLIANARTRNNWLNDEILQARLLSFVPLHLQNAFSAIHKSRVPDQNQRGRMFERAMQNLVNWWISDFFEVLPEGHLKNRTFDEIQRGLKSQGVNTKKSDNTEDISLEIDVDVLQDVTDDDLEPIRSAKSLMKHTIMQRGSRDVSAQLFTALCRGLGIPSRLVASIQSVPWQAGIGKPRPKYSKKVKLKGKEVIKDDTTAELSSAGSVIDSSIQDRQIEEEPVEATSQKAKGKQKAKPVIKLRKTEDQGSNLSQAPTRLESPDPLTTPPVFWTEVFSRPDSKWFPIDSLRGSVNKRKVFDPTPVQSSNPAISAALNRIKVENRMLYVLAFEEDNYARDVTRRYARQFGAKVAKMQGGSSAPNIGGGGKGRQAWWEKVVNAIHRPFRLHRDDLEDQELDAAQMMEGMPTTVTGFKDHPLYVLERHLKQTETIYPPPPITLELGKFRGESVYPRSAVVPLKTAENWMRNAGRTVKVSEQPMKMIKLRANTVNKMRELEVMKDELKVAGEGSTNHAETMQGLYAYSQTEPYVPDPVIDGVVPKNNFGNIDLYVPSMLPAGAVHVPFKGVAKIARKLGFDFAEAVTGFEFRKRRAFPALEGIVIAVENEAALLEAYWEAERDTEEKARIKREERVLKQWTRLVHGLRIRQSLQEKYGKKSNEKHLDAQRTDRMEEETSNDHSNESAGFLIGEGADGVVSAFHLPKNTHPVLPSSTSQVLLNHRGTMNMDGGHESDAREEPELQTYDLDESGLEEGMQGVIIANSFVPKTMQQLAEDATEFDKGDQAQHEDDFMTTSPVSIPPAEAASSTTDFTAKTNQRQTRLRARLATSTYHNSPSTPITRKTALRVTAVKTHPKQDSMTRNDTGKRKRAAKDGTEDAEVSDDEPTADAEELKHSEVDEDMELRGRSSNKRAKAIETRDAPLRSQRIRDGPNAGQTPTRTLRPRASKSAAQLQRERDAEESYRRAAGY